MKTLKEIWQDFAHFNAGTYQDISSHYPQKVEFYYEGFVIIFDIITEYRTSGGSTMQKSYTRAIVPFASLSDFRFLIFTTDILSKIQKFFGVQDVIIGDEKFDELFTIKSNDEFKVKSLFSNIEIKEWIKKINDPNLLISKQKNIRDEELPENTFELSFFTEGQITDLNQLNIILSLLKMTILELHKLIVIRAFKD